MATSPAFAEQVVEAAGLGQRLSCRAMFGEYGYHLDGTFIALACDGHFYLKPTAALIEHGLDLPSAPPYKGAKDHALADALLDHPDLLRRVLLDTLAHLPPPKAKR
jgi:TfoX/Sxy family transcriptional regulator of competence genes